MSIFLSGILTFVVTVLVGLIIAPVVSAVEFVIILGAGALLGGIISAACDSRRE